MRPILLSPAWRTACTVLQVAPLPGLGAVLAGRKNPHTGLLGRGLAQMSLVILGSWPLVLPGAAGFLWAAWDAVQIHRRARPPGPMSLPVEGQEGGPTG